MNSRIGFGGGCHWCTEAVFASIKGIRSVSQGWIASDDPDAEFSEAVLLEYNPEEIKLDILIGIHLHTHSCTSTHSMRGKYRSAVYYFYNLQRRQTVLALTKHQIDFKEPIITQALSFREFRLNKPEALNYYYKDPQRPFCQVYIGPKLKLLLDKFRNYAITEQLEHLK